jgi:hypothetical protein
MSTIRFSVIASSALTFAAAWGFVSTRPTPAGAHAQQGPTAPNGETVGGIACDAQEGQRIHIHQHLVIFDHGHEVAIPPNVGQPAAKRCIYWLHTHTPDGIIHIEAPLDRSFTLGDFFKVWGQPLSRSKAATAVAAKGGSLKVWVDGKPYAGDPSKIPLEAHTDIVIEAGPPFPKPPRFTNWGTL